MSNTPMPMVLNVIKSIRDSFNDSVKVYTQGSCVKFAMILKTIFPKGEILYNLNHAVFELDGNCYDVQGIAKKEKNHIRIEEYGILHAYKIMNLKYKTI
jgi:hypothetical protein